MPISVFVTGLEGVIVLMIVLQITELMLDGIELSEVRDGVLEMPNYCFTTSTVKPVVEICVEHKIFVDDGKPWRITLFDNILVVFDNIKMTDILYNIT